MSAADTQRKSERTRERIIASAVAIFDENGFAATRLTDIAERAGMKAGSLYYHFDSKEELIFTLVERGVDRIFAAVTTRVAGVPRTEALRRLEVAVDAHMRTALDADEYSAATVRMYGQIPAEVNALLRPRYDEIARYWKRLVSAAQRQGAFRTDVTPEVASLLILGALNWTTTWYRPDRHSLDTVIAGAQRMLLGTPTG